MSAEYTPCPQCGSELPDDAPQGLCPRCLGALNFATETMPPGAVPVPARALLTPEELAPHFPQLEILECLGRGGMGVVYKARQKSLNRLVALKLLAPERAEDAKFAARFEKEAQALAALNHPHIVTIHDFGQAGGFFFLLMEFVDGVNLRQAMQAGRFTPEQALAIVPPVCEALQYAHEHGIVHRDIKPENLLLDKAGRVKIADFGIARMIGSPLTAREERGADASTNVSGAADEQTAGASPRLISRSEMAAFGTPAYAAPEQANGSADHRADIYSLGVVLYELLTGELPKDKIEPPSKRVQIDVRLDEIVLRALETRPELRFATAAEFRTQLAGVTAKAEVEASRPPSSRQRRWLGVLGMVLGGVLLAGAPVLNEAIDDSGFTGNARKHLQTRRLAEERVKILKAETAAQYNQLEMARKKADAAEAARLTGEWQALQARTRQAESALNQAAVLKQADEQQRIALIYLIAGGLIAAGVFALLPCRRFMGSRGMRIGIAGAVCAGVLAVLFMLRQSGVFHLAAAQVSSSSSATTPQEQFGISLTAFGLPFVVLSVILGGFIWFIRLLFKRQRIGCAVMLILLLVLFLLCVFPSVMWYLSAGTPGHAVEHAPVPGTSSTPLKRSPVALEKQFEEKIQGLRQQKEALVRSGSGAQHPQVKSIEVQITQLEKRIELEQQKQVLALLKLASTDPRFMTSAGTRELNRRYTLVVGAKPLRGHDGSSQMRGYTLKSSADDGTNGVVTFAPLAIENESFIIYWDRETDELWLASPSIARWHHLPESGKPSEQMFMQPDIPEFFKQRLPEPFREVVAQWYPGETSAGSKPREITGRDLTDFLKTPYAGRVALIATLTRKHYFADDVPEAAAMACFRVDAEQVQRNAFLHQTDPLYKNLSTLLRWGESRRFKVTLIWRQNGAKSWLELVGAELLDKPEEKR